MFQLLNIIEMNQVRPNHPHPNKVGCLAIRTWIKNTESITLGSWFLLQLIDSFYFKIWFMKRCIFPIATIVWDQQILVEGNPGFHLRYKKCKL